MTSIARTLKDVSHPVRRWIASSILPGYTSSVVPEPTVSREWRHEWAQASEAEHNSAWLREHGRQSMAEIDEVSRFKPAELTYREFFQCNERLWEEFANHLDGRTILNVGCGPIPKAAEMPWAKRRIMIDPLIETYDREFKAIFGGRSVFDGMERFSQKAERFIPQLESKIDGAIICRNALDGMEFPAIVLSNLSSYAQSGCKLLLWTNVVHHNGGDRGHHSIALDVDSFARLVGNLGFSIERLTPEANNGSTAAWGCFAVKS